MMKQNKCFKGDGASCIYLLITNPKFNSWLQIPLKLIWVIIIIYIVLKTKFWTKETNVPQYYAALWET